MGKIYMRKNIILIGISILLLIGCNDESLLIAPTVTD